MKVIRAIIIFTGLTFFTNDNLSISQDKLLVAPVIEKQIPSAQNIDELVNSFDQAIQHGDVNIFYQKIKQENNTSNN